MCVDFLPVAPGLGHQHRKADREHQIFSRCQMIVTPTVGMHVWSNVLPRDYDEKAQINPPDQQEREIQIADVYVQIVALVVRLQCERADHRHGMQEEDYVSDEGIGDALAKVHFKIRPNALACEPGEAAQTEE